MDLSIRLNQVSPELVEYGERLTSDERSLIARLIAKWACSTSHSEDYLNDDIQSYFETGKLISIPERRELEKTIQYIDNKYFDIMEDGGHIDVEKKAMYWFQKARSLNSVMYAIDSKNLDSFYDCLYEALAATNDVKKIKEICYLTVERLKNR